MLGELRGDAVELYQFDDAYLAKLRAGDEETVRHFTEYFSRLLLIKLRARQEAPHVIDDIRQETFLRLFTILGRESGGVQEASRLGAFVNSVCNNVLLEHYRARNRVVCIDDTPEMSDNRVDLNRQLVDDERKRLIADVLEKMPQRDRELLRALFLEERDKDAICKSFDVDRAYLRVLLHRAKQQFRNHGPELSLNGVSSKKNGFA